MRYFLLLVLIITACADKPSVYAPERQILLNTHEDFFSREQIVMYDCSFTVNTKDISNWYAIINFKDSSVSNKDLKGCLELTNNVMYIHCSTIDSTTNDRFISINFFFIKEMY